MAFLGRMWSVSVRISSKFDGMSRIFVLDLWAFVRRTALIQRSRAVLSLLAGL